VKPQRMIRATVDLTVALFRKCLVCMGNTMPNVRPPTLKQEAKHIFAVIKRLARRPFIRRQMQSRVRKGVIFLHNVKPGWWENIDLERLDMLDTKLCLCGQLYGRHRNAYRKLRLTPADFVMYGFLPAPGDYGRPEFLPQRLLTRLWIKEITRLKSKSLEQSSVVGQKDCSST